MIFILILGLFLVSGGFFMVVDGWHWFGGFSVLFGLFLLYETYKERNLQREKDEIRERLIKILKEKKEAHPVPKNAVTVGKGEYLLWYTDGRLNWFPSTFEIAYTNVMKTKFDESRIRFYSIPKQDIYYYAQTGEVHTTVSGTGGGSSFSLLTGFNGKIDPIHISTTVHDNRYTQLLYKDEGQDYEFDFAFDDIGVLRRFLPEKDYEVVAKVEAEKQIQQARPAEPKDEKEKLQKAKELLDAGLITQEEYEQARQKALNNLLS